MSNITISLIIINHFSLLFHHFNIKIRDNNNNNNDKIMMISINNNNIKKDAIIKTGGGCCDCGDEEAWKPEGFCKNHRRDTSIPIDQLLVQSFKERTQKIILAILHHWIYLLAPCMSNTNLDSKNILAVIGWMEDLIDCFGDAGKWILGSALAHHFTDPNELSFFSSIITNESLFYHYHYH